MPKYKRFLFITTDYELGKKIATDLWERKKSWCVVSTDDIYNQSIKTFMNNDDDYKLLIVTTPDKILQKKVNYFINYCDKYNVLPIFITKKSTYDVDMTHIMYSNIGDILEDSLEYIHNDEEDFDFIKNDESYINDYDYMLNILTEYLW